MDIEKLIEQLKSAAGGPEGIKMCQGRKREAAGNVSERKGGLPCYAGQVGSDEAGE